MRTEKQANSIPSIVTFIQFVHGKHPHISLKVTAFRNTEPSSLVEVDGRFRFSRCRA
jgi:hypothetical protein